VLLYPDKWQIYLVSSYGNPNSKLLFNANFKFFKKLFCNNFGVCLNYQFLLPTNFVELAVKVEYKIFAP